MDIAQLYLSNDKEKLVSHLLQNLQRKKELFDFPCIIVPDLQMKPFLYTQIADKSGSAFGFDVCTLHDAIEKIVQTPLLQELDFLYLLHASKDKSSSFTDELRFQKESEETAHLCVKSSFEQEPCDAFSKLQEKEHVKAAKDILDTDLQPPFKEIHIFGFETLHPVYFHFFEKLSKKIPVFFYFISPCMMFWSDIYSNRSIESLKKRIDEKIFHSYKDLYFDRNELLANLGKKGRVFALLLDESKALCTQSYHIPAQALIDEEYKDLIPKDGFYTTSQDLFLLDRVKLDLLFLKSERKEKKEIDAFDHSIQIHNTKTITHEVQVLFEAVQKAASKISKLEPITAGDIVITSPDISMYTPHLARVFGSKNSPFSYQNLERNETDYFSYLFDLPLKRFSKKALLRLIGCAPFAKKHNLEFEDIRLIENLFSQFSFQWGFDQKQRSYLFSKVGFDGVSCDDRGSWTHFEKNLMSDLLSTQSILSFTSSQHILECFHTIRSIFEFFENWMQKECSLTSWIEQFSSLFDKCFSLENKEQERLRSSFDLLLKTNAKCEELQISIYSFSHIFHQALGQKEDSHYVQKEVVFAPLSAISSLQPKILCILGLNEAACVDADFAYTFIQALLLPKNLFYISYQGFSFEENQEIQPHGALREFQSYLQKNFSLSLDIVQNHKYQAHQFAPFEKKISIHTKKETTSSIEYIDIDYLRKVIRSPLTPYFQSAYHLYFPFTERENIRKLRNSALFLPDEMVQNHIDSSLKSPALQRAVKVLLDEDRKAFDHAAHTCGIAKKPQTIELALDCKAAFHVDEQHLVVPALSFEYEDKKIELYGSMQNFVDSRYLVLETVTEKSLTKAFPDIVVASCLESNECFQGAFFSKDQKVKEISFSNPYATLKAYVHYALECKKQPFGLYPGLIKSIMEKENEMHSKMQKIEDPYLSIFLQRTDEKKLQEHLSTWKDYAENLFLEYFELMSKK